MLDRRSQERIIQLQEVVQVLPQRMLAGLTPNPTRSVPPYVDLRRQIALTIAQEALLFPEWLPLFGTGFKELASDLVEFIAYGNKLALDRICLTIERLLYLSQAEPYHKTLPSPVFGAKKSFHKYACSSESFNSPRWVSARSIPKI